MCKTKRLYMNEIKYKFESEKKLRKMCAPKNNCFFVLEAGRDKDILKLSLDGFSISKSEAIRLSSERRDLVYFASIGLFGRKFIVSKFLLDLVLPTSASITTAAGVFNQICEICKL